MNIHEFVVGKNGGEQAGSIDNYDIVKLLGKGGSGKVYLVTSGGSEYAMKVPLNVDVRVDGDTHPFGAELNIISKYKEEANHWSLVSEEAPDSVVRMVDYNTSPYIWAVMEKADRDFETAINEGKATEDDFISLLNALQKIHDAGVVHCDIKPRNIMRVNGRWKFCDFGLSQIVGQFTDVPEGTGTPECMAPEQWRKKMGVVDFRTDIWQMGILLFQILTGHIPYDTDDAAEIMTMAVGEGPDLSDAPVEYLPILKKALARDKDDRFSTCTEFKEAMLGSLSGTSSTQQFHDCRFTGNVKTGSPEFSENMRLYKSHCGTGSQEQSLKRFEDSDDRLCQTMAALMRYYGWDVRQNKLSAGVMLRKLWMGLDEFEPLEADGDILWIEAWMMQTGLFGKYSREDVMDALQQSSLRGSCLGQYDAYCQAETPDIMNLALAADQGYLPAILELAKQYESGNAVPKSLKDSAAWYEKASELGDMVSAYRLGLLYENGRGVPESAEKAAELYRKAADGGITDAQYRLGCMYEDGKGVETSFEEALVWYTKSAESGSADAQYRLGCMYENGTGTEASLDTALDWYEKAAECGNPNAQFRMAEAYRNGIGVNKSIGRAASYYQDSAKNGIPEAQYQLGYCYEFGKGVERSYSDAAEWYILAVNQGNLDAQFRLGVLYENGRGVKRSTEKAAELYDMPARAGNPNAQNNLGVLYRQGRGVQQSDIKAALLFQKAAEKGILTSIFSLAYMYEHGEGVSQSYPDAAYWYQKAADAGDGQAQTNLADMYFLGLGVEQDKGKAVELYKLAVSQNIPEAQCHLGKLYLTGDSVRQSEGQALGLLQKAANQGLAEAQYEIGNIYYHGDYMPKPESYENAFRYYTMASDQGYVKAYSGLAELYLLGDGVQKDVQKAVGLFGRAAESGDSQAMYYLGFIYKNGIGVRQDYGKANDLLEKSAGMGHSRAMDELGMSYIQGEGVRQDYSVARGYFEKGAELDDPDCIFHIGYMLEYGYGTPQSYQDAWNMYVKSSNMGHRKSRQALERLKSKL